VRINLRTLLIVSTLVLVLLAGCQPQASATPDALPTELPPDVPVLTPTATVPLAIIVVPADMDPSRSDLYQTTVYELAQADGYRFQVRNALSPADLEPGLRVVIVVGADPGLAALTAAAPGVQFLALEIDGLTPGGNLSVVSAEAGRPDIPAFLAGYIAAMVTEDYHAGVMLLEGDPQSDAIATAFRNGTIYYCGLCNPYYGPFLEYPLEVTIPLSASLAEHNAYANYLVNQKVETMYIPPSLATADLLTYVNSTGAWTLGPYAPPRKVSGWVVSILPDYLAALRTAWPELTAGRGGVAFPSSLVLAEANPEILTEGRQRLAEEVLHGLLDGSIGTGVNP